MSNEAEHDLADGRTRPGLERTPEPRYWPAVVLVGLYWAYHLLCRQFELDMFVLFVSRMAVTALVVLVFPIWWLTNRRVKRGDRWLAAAVALFAMIAAAVLAVPNSIGGMVLMGLPWAYTAATAWLLVARRAAPPAWRLGLIVAICLPFALLTLLRWEGLSGDQRSQLRWRWEPTAEERFLDARVRARGDASANQTVARAEALDAGPVVADARDWTQFRGRDRDGVVPDAEIGTDWRAHPPRLIWRQRVGPAWSSVIVVGGRLYTQEQRGDREAVVCYDAATGREQWALDDESRFVEGVSGVGPRATPTFASGRVFTLGAKGKLNCVDAASGHRLWAHDLVEESGAPLPEFGFWGMSCSPLVAGSVVVAYSALESSKTLTAYDVETGEAVWSFDAGASNYSSPQLATFGGTPQILFMGQNGLVALEPVSGKLLWQAAKIKAAQATVQPHVIGEAELLVAADAGLTRLEVTLRDGAWSVTECWTKPSRALRPSFNDFVVCDGAVFGFDEGIFGSIDYKTGKRLWKQGRYGHGQVLLLSDSSLLLIMAETGEIVLAEADKHGLREIATLRALDGKTWNHPVVAHGRLFVRNAEEMACFNLTP
jgi:outer membrane protein assembly factor BamB